MTLLKKAGVALAAGVVAGSALAAPAPPDVSDLVGLINNMWPPIASVLGAFTGIVLAVKAWKLVRRA